MIIRIKENNPERLIQVMRAHWDEKSKTVIGNIVDFADELMKQSGYAIFFYHVNFWTPVSIIRKRKYETEDKPDDYIYEIDIEKRIDDQLTGQSGDSNEYNTWYGRYGQKSELVQYINNRYKHYMNIMIKKLNLSSKLTSEKKAESKEQKETITEIGESRCFICGISDEEELLILAKKRGKNLWICSKCIPKTMY